MLRTSLVLSEFIVLMLSEDRRIKKARDERVRSLWAVTNSAEGHGWWARHSIWIGSGVAQFVRTMTCSTSVWCRPGIMRRCTGERITVQK